MSLFVINIGNTRIQTGLWQDGTIQAFRQVPRGEFNLDSLPDGLPLAAATVVPAARSLFVGRPVFWLDSTAKTGLDLHLIDLATFGTDRLANSIALAHFAALPGICIDCGTAITFESVDAQRVLRGGAIAPGRRLLRRVLHEHTAQLPEIPMSEALPPGIGTTTAEAIRCGVDLGALGMVREVLGGIRREIGAPDCPAIVTGGDAEFFAEHLPDLTFGGGDFTLRGIAAAWEMNHAR
jgi:type III pantothenate kinase